MELGTLIAQDIQKHIDGSQKLMAEMGDTAKELTLKHTKEGVDAHGNPYAPLSRKHARRKVKRGFDPIPDFRYTQGSINKMVVEATDGEVSDYFTGRVKRDVGDYIPVDRMMNFHQTGASRNPVRKIFPDKDWKALDEAVEPLITKHMNG